MNQSIYTERENILPHHAEWLDRCGAKWEGGQSFSKFYPASLVVFNGKVENGFTPAISELISDSYTHIPTGDEFCERVAEILGVKKPVFEQFGNSEQVDISKKETTTDHIPYVGQKVDEQDKLFPGRNNTMGEGSLTQEDIHTLLGDKVSPSYKTYRILDSLDGIPLDKRIPLSEWIPPVGQKVLVITENWFMDGFFERIESKIIFETAQGSKALTLDGHWMRIV